MDQELVLSICKRHVAYGQYVLIKFYDMNRGCVCWLNPNARKQPEEHLVTIDVNFACYFRLALSLLFDLANIYVQNSN